VGGCQDVLLIIDFLGAFLFPNGERTIQEFAATGISLGGKFSPIPSFFYLSLHPNNFKLIARKRNMAPTSNRYDPQPE
jgi:ABC-type enterochelin transport system permease subunit